MQSKQTNSVGGYKVLVGKQLVPVQNLHLGKEEEPVNSIENIFLEANDILSQPVEKPPLEDVLIDGQSYFSITPRNPWDCETILSTYSNLDNHPTTIPKRKSKKKNLHNISQIQLSNKTGLPLPLEKDRFSPPPSENKVNLGEARTKTESKEDKKKRKAMAKNLRNQKKDEKKVFKYVYQQEYMKNNYNGIADAFRDLSIYPYS